MSNNKLYEKITERIIALMEQGHIPWQLPWQAFDRSPRNLVSGHHYTGGNLFFLLFYGLVMGYESPYWLTYRQLEKATDGRGYVRKGEHGVTCIRVSVMPPKVEIDEATGEKVEVRPAYKRAFPFTLFNVEQCMLRAVVTLDALPAIEQPTDLITRRVFKAEDQPLPYPTFEGELNLDWEPIDKAEEILDNMPNPPVVEHGAPGAYYHRVEDVIHLPEIEACWSEDSYYKTRFHETVHATGHADRLNREAVAGTDRVVFGSDDYSEEEMVAEFGAAFLCGVAHIDNEDNQRNSAAYIQHWIGKLRDDPSLLVKAASKAQEAANYILGVSDDEES